MKGYVHQGLLGPTQPDYYVYNPAMAEVYSQHVYSKAMIAVAKKGSKAADAIDVAFKRDQGDIRQVSDPAVVRGDHDRCDRT